VATARQHQERDCDCGYRTFVVRSRLFKQVTAQAVKIAGETAQKENSELSERFVDYFSVFLWTSQTLFGSGYARLGILSIK
jgi:hypothetical protein